MKNRLFLLKSKGKIRQSFFTIQECIIKTVAGNKWKNPMLTKGVKI